MKDEKSFYEAVSDANDEGLYVTGLYQLIRPGSQNVTGIYLTDVYQRVSEREHVKPTEQAGHKWFCALGRLDPKASRISFISCSGTGSSPAEAILSALHKWRKGDPSVGHKSRVSSLVRERERVRMQEGTPKTRKRIRIERRGS